MKKPLKFGEKTRKKTGSSIDEKPPKLDEETIRKTDHFVALFVISEIFTKSS